MSDLPPSPDEHLPIDVDLTIKDREHTDGFPGAVDDLDEPVPGDPVALPGDAAANASGSRAVVPGAQNWIPIGPRNVGGRITALVVDPSNVNIMYAGAASGGVFKSIDGGQSWFPLWQDEASLPVGAIDISATAPGTIWVGTGAVRAGGAEIIRGDGVYRSTDGGQTWTAPGPPGAAPSFGFSFDAVAADPTLPAVCWAVGPAGVFRTTNSGVAWTQFAATFGTYFSDVAFNLNAAGNPILYLARADSTAGEAIVIRIDAPNANDAAIEVALAAAANQTVVIPAPPPPAPAVNLRPGRAKLAVAPSNRNVVYIRVVTGGGADLGIFRSTNARTAPPSAVAWAPLSTHGDWANERQGMYNLSLAVSPANSNHVASGMVELYTSTNANVANPANVIWNRATAWDLYHIDRGHHADNHAALFVQRGGTVELWAGNDGGISMSTDWATGNSYVAATVSRRTTLPLPAGVTTWQKRSAGLLISQMYDLTQSPTIPTMLGCGFQDNGVFITTGGGSWDLVLGADGGFVAFDPDDPYHFLATWQGGVTAVDFPGKLEGTIPTAGDGITTSLWPRRLSQGFAAEDGALFVADTAYDPYDSDRVLMGRRNRLYGLRRAASGDTWAPEPAGDTFELRAPVIGGSSSIRIQGSAGADVLGLEPQLASNGAGNRARIRSRRRGPYSVPQGSTLSLVVNGAASVVTFQPTTRLPNLATATAAQVAAEIVNQVGAGISVGSVFDSRPTAVELETAPLAAPGVQTVTIGGTVFTAIPPRLQLAAGVHRSLPGGRATVRIPIYDPASNQFADATPPPAPPPQPAGPLTLTVQVGANPVRTVTFAQGAGAGQFADPSSLRAGELAAILRTALAPDQVTVTTTSSSRLIAIFGTAGNVTFAGSALPALGIAAGAASVRTASFRRNRLLNLGAGAIPHLTITDGVGNVATVNFTAATVANPALVGADEFRTAVANAVTVGAVAARVDKLIFPSIGGPTEIAFSPTTQGRVWVGGQAGSIEASDDGGQTWRTIRWPAMEAQDRRVEAIAYHPTEPNTIYVGLYGERKDLAGWANNPIFMGTGPADPGFLFRTTDGGSTWTHIGAMVVDGGAPPSLVSINAIETDPAAPNAVYAATNIGVFASTDRGNTWATFNQGLPNVWIRDLAFEPSTRMLRAGAWGRGVYERHVGDDPANDTALYIRANPLDMGHQRPAPRGPDPLSDQPSRTAQTSASPDIKVTRSAPAGLIAPGTFIDGAVFDDELEHEPPTPGPAHVFVQVHNRGPIPATGVRVVALWADVTAGIPPLPPLFWFEHAEGGALDAAQGDWNLIGDHTITDPGATGADRVTPDMPRVHRFDVNFPAEVGDMTSVGLLVVLDSTEDINGSVEEDVEKLLETERKAAYRQSLAVHPTEDAQLYLRGIGGAQISVAAAPAPSALTALGWAAGVGPVPATLAGSQPHDVRQSGGNDRGILISTQATPVVLSFTVAFVDFPAPGAVSAALLSDVLNREFIEAGLGFRARSAGGAVRIDGRGGAQLAATGGTLQALLGLPIPAPVVTGPSSIGATAGPFALGAAGTVHTLNLQVDGQRVVRFSAPDFTNLRTASTREVRAVVNRAMVESGLPVRAEVPQSRLRVQGSVTDVEGPEPRLGGAHLAELTAQGAASIPPANRPGLFRLLPVLGADRITASANNFLYLRVTNAGNVDATNAQVRLFVVTIGDPADATDVEVDVTQIDPDPVAAGSDLAVTVPAAGSAVVEGQWNPGAVSGEVYVLAVANVTGRTVTIPPTFPTFSDFHRFCATNPQIAYRSFQVA